MITGEITFIKPESFQGKDGNTIHYHQVIVNGVQYSCYNKGAATKKVGDTIQFEAVDRGNGRWQMKLAGDDAPKSYGKPQDSDAMFRCNAMTNAVNFFKGDNIEGLLTTYNKMYSALNGSNTTKSEPSQPTVNNTLDKPANTERAVMPGQVNAIKNMAKKQSMSEEAFVTAVLGYFPGSTSSLSFNEASEVIKFYNDKDVPF